ncbi:MAG: low molecular weight phosphotyrosine protein phosphatase [Melioribacteraceae bacterium]|jgi:protein-tyrosine phosphatase|nr:low molecular weight phosphotyrosine protein phosphatase [Melioribacteraceae bacterium]
MIKILFVCMGNICRSPSGEAVMNAIIKKNNLQNRITCDSAGTIAYHSGEPADARMKKHAIKRGFDLTSIARQINLFDFEQFDYVITMDDENYRNVKALDVEDKYEHKVYKMMSFGNAYTETEVPDPYYGGEQGFEYVLDLLEDACTGLLKHIIEKGDKAVVARPTERIDEVI